MIIGSLTSLFWLLVLMLVITYMFAIVLTQGATEAKRKDLSNMDDVKEFYGSIPTSMFTLYQSMIGGVDWGVPAKASLSLGGMYFCTYLGFIFMNVFCVLNIVTGVFVD